MSGELLDCLGRRRSPATTSAFHTGRPPWSRRIAREPWPSRQPLRSGLSHPEEAHGRHRDRRGLSGFERSSVSSSSGEGHSRVRWDVRQAAAGRCGESARPGGSAGWP